MAGDARKPRETPTPLPRWFAAVVAVAIATGVAGSVLFAAGRFAVGAGMFLLSVGLLRWPVSIWTPRGPADLSPRAQRLGLLGVCTVGVFFRFYHLEPPGLWGDDAINALLALDVLDGKIGSPFTLIGHAFSTFHALSNFVIAGAFWLLGPDLYSLRLPGVVVNLLCVPLLFGATAPLFGPRTALLAALCFASSPFQLGHAKGLLQNPLGQFFEVLGLCLLVQGGGRGRHWCLVAAGAPIALSLYTYHAAKLVPAIAAVALWQLLRRARARGVRWHAATLGSLVVFVACAVPAAVTYTRQSGALTGRFAATGLWATIQAGGDWWLVWESFWRTFTIFHYQQGPIYHWFGIGSDPGLTALTAALVLHGLVQSVRHWYEPRHGVLLGWFLLGLLPGLLSTEAPRGYRVLVATPPLYVWAALPLARLLAIATRQQARALRGLVVAAVVAGPLIDFNYYFYRVYTNGTFRGFQAAHMVEMARALRDRGPGWVGYLLADTFDASYESLRFLRRIWGLDLRDAASLADVIPVVDDGRAGTLFLLNRGTLEAAAALRLTYPDVAIELRHGPPARSWWFDHWGAPRTPSLPPVTIGIFALPREAAARVRSPQNHGLLGEYTGSAGTIRRLEPFPYYFFFPPTLPGAYSVHWHGRLQVAAADGVRLHPESNVSLEIRIDGRPWTRDQLLTPGAHAFDLSGANIIGSLRLRLYWQPPDAERELIPPDAFAPD